MQCRPKLIFVIIFLLTGACIDRPVCIEPGKEVAVTYTDASGTQIERVMVGADFGKLAANNGSYQCMGRCGIDCDSDPRVGPWLLNCLSHDICSFRNASRDFFFDSQCGDEAWLAFRDALIYRVRGCSALNPEVTSP
jgi:hypothetical protein